MKSKSFLLLIGLVANCLISTKAMAQKNTVAAGGDATGVGGTVSYSIGQINYTTVTSAGGSVSQGLQQVYLLIFNLKTFIEGYYIAGSEQMQPVLFNAGVSANQSICDSIIVALHDQFNPNILLATDHVVLNIDGTAYAQFPASLSGTSTYLSIRSRNGIETWSKLPVTLGLNTSFDFTAP